MPEPRTIKVAAYGPGLSEHVRNAVGLVIHPAETHEGRDLYTEVYEHAARLAQTLNQGDVVRIYCDTLGIAEQAAIDAYEDHVFTASVQVLMYSTKRRDFYTPRFPRRLARRGEWLPFREYDALIGKAIQYFALEGYTGGPLLPKRGQLYRLGYKYGNLWYYQIELKDRSVYLCRDKRTGIATINVVPQNLVPFDDLHFHN